MKPAPFTWHGPTSVEEAVAVLGEVGEHAKILAGGQSLLPVLAMRLAEPADLVDINGVAGLDTISATADGVRIGALVRHAQLENSADAAATQPLIRDGLRLVAHPTIRNRGTTVGSLAHADPSGEMTAVLTLLGGRITARSVRGSRDIEAADFFVGPLESCLAPDELAVEAFFPALPANSGTAFVEIARRHGDYALCGVGAVATVEPGGAEAGVVTSLRCGYLSVSEVPLAVDLTDAWNSGPKDAAAAAEAAVDPEPDIHATAEYRRRLAGVLTERVAGKAIAAALAAAGLPTAEPTATPGRNTA